MKSLDVQDMLEHSRCAVAVLRALKMTEQKMTYQQFARAIGLMADADTWNARYKTVVGEVLKLVAATEKRVGKNSAIANLEYGRVVNARTGKSGDGLAKESRLVTS